MARAEAFELPAFWFVGVAEELLDVENQQLRWSALLQSVAKYRRITQRLYAKR